MHSKFVNNPCDLLIVPMTGKRRRKEGGFPGSAIITDQLTRGVKRKRVGLLSQGPVLRQQYNIVDDQGLCIGHITSGCFSPTLSSNVAMAYVPKKISTVGGKINVAVRNRTVKAKISKFPFVPSKYYFYTK